ncbi:MAG: hypothetical protein NVSMB48_20030 [Marmoricola sp.]
MAKTLQTRPDRAPAQPPDVNDTVVFLTYDGGAGRDCPRLHGIARDETSGSSTMGAEPVVHSQAPEPAVLPELSERDRDILDFERQWWKFAGAKEQAVREKFDMSSTRYYQVLNALLDRPEALEHDPLLVRRLRRLRAARQRQRSARRLGFEV